MLTSIFGNTITFSFNTPVSETGFLSENFDLTKKSAYATIGIQDLLKFKNDIQLQFILSKIFSAINETAKIQKLDYFQNININGNDVWCIDDGNTICLMLKEEY
ncbi:MAG: hypothetical protein HHAS10_12030 [Candidatus Altimarinota bacterium]